MTYYVDLALNSGAFHSTSRRFDTLEAAQAWVRKAHKGRAHRIYKHTPEAVWPQNEVVYEVKGRPDCLSHAP